jgi:quercetin dioxygenase-like cupin family protein
MNSKPKRYNWGDGCQAWQLVNTPSLSVIRETMPPGSSEKLHKHNKSQQYFFVLKGSATFTIGGEPKTVIAGKGIHVKAKTLHQVVNSSTEELEMLIISEPHSHHDRIDFNE